MYKIILLISLSSTLAFGSTFFDRMGCSYGLVSQKRLLESMRSRHEISSKRIDELFGARLLKHLYSQPELHDYAKLLEDYKNIMRQYYERPENLIVRAKVLKKTRSLTKELSRLLSAEGIPHQVVDNGVKGMEIAFDTSLEYSAPKFQQLIRTSQRLGLKKITVSPFDSIIEGYYGFVSPTEMRLETGMFGLVNIMKYGEGFNIVKHELAHGMFAKGRNLRQAATPFNTTLLAAQTKNLLHDQEGFYDVFMSYEELYTFMNEPFWILDADVIKSALARNSIKEIFEVMDESLRDGGTLIKAMKTGINDALNTIEKDLKLVSRPKDFSLLKLADEEYEQCFAIDKAETLFVLDKDFKTFHFYLDNEVRPMVKEYYKKLNQLIPNHQNYLKEMPGQGKLGEDALVLYKEYAFDSNLQQKAYQELSQLQQQILEKISLQLNKFENAFSDIEKARPDFIASYEKLQKAQARLTQEELTIEFNSLRHEARQLSMPLRKIRELK